MFAITDQGDLVLRDDFGLGLVVKQLSQHNIHVTLTSLIPHNKQYYLEAVDVDPALVGCHAHGLCVWLRLDHSHGCRRALGVLRVVEVQHLNVLTIMKKAFTISITKEIFQE
jgi:hypothetical protein